MTLRLQKKWIAVAILIFVLAAAITVSVFALNARHSSSQSDYPTLPEPQNAETIVTSLGDQVKASSLIVDATVAEVLPDETREFTPEKGSVDEKIFAENGMQSAKYTVRPIKLNIVSTMKGKSDGETVTLYIPPAGLDCAPQFKKGDRLVFMLSSYADGYTGTTLQDGYYHVSADSKIYPAVVTDQLKAQSGRKLDDFENEIKTLAGAQN